MRINPTTVIRKPNMINKIAAEFTIKTPLKAEWDPNYQAIN